MRIIAGRWRGRALLAPAGATTRPTGERAREALFSMLTSRLGSFDGLRVADLFAGTGALGLEALSRGAAHCTFVEQDRAALEALRANIAKLGADPVSEVRPGAVSSFAGGPFDLVLADPPYRSGIGHAALARARLAPGGWASLETAQDEDGAVEGLEVIATRRHGRSLLTLLRAPIIG